MNGSLFARDCLLQLQNWFGSLSQGGVWWSAADGMLADEFKGKEINLTMLVHSSMTLLVSIKRTGCTFDL